MTEQEWLESEDLRVMLECPTTVASPRKLRLFAVACCRRVWHLLDDPRGFRAIKTAERYADGQTTGTDLVAAQVTAWAAARAAASEAARRAAQATARATALEATTETCWDAAAETAAAAWTDAWYAYPADARIAARDDARDAARAFQVILLRDIFGNPFRPVDIPSGCLTPTVLNIASLAYDGRAEDGVVDPMALAVLADALLDAGCEDEMILAHLRGPTHVRGCWALDRILGRS